jgi:phage shock protein PspC (stress-responsive transcriptional regulator)
MAFIIDENAFELLHNYLEALKRKFSNETERDEILNDIEARIGELLNQKIADRKEVVSVAEVQAVMDAMGKPEDIAGEETVEPTATGSNNQQTNTVFTGQVKKRLFRDADDAKVSGVIAGLCHYFGINDPVWMRIAALVLIPLTSGSIILLYLLLMIIVPKALSSAEKLQMKGEPININTIEKEIKDAFTRTGESANKFMREETFFEKLGGIVVALIKAFFKFLLLIAVGVSICALIGVFIGFVVFYFLGTSQLNEATLLLVDGTHTLTYFSFGFLLFLGVPCVAVIVSGLRVFLGNNSGAKWLKWVLLGVWLVGVLLLSITGYKTAVSFRGSKTNSKQMALIQPTNGALLVQLTDSTGRKVNKDDEEDIESFNINDEGVIVNGINLKDMERIPVAKPDLEIMPSVNDSFYLQQIITARGKNTADAGKNADATIYTFNQNNDTLLNLNPRLYIGKNGKYRAQSMKIRIAIPEGKKISFADNIDLWHAIVKGNSNFDDTYFANTTWTVENGKVKCIAGENHFNAEKDEVLTEDESNVVDEHGKKLKKQIRILKEKAKDKEDNSDDEDKDKDF